MNSDNSCLKRKFQLECIENNFSINNKRTKMNDFCQYLMPIHFVTCGLQGHDLGRDETALLQIGFQLIDVNKRENVGGSLLLLRASSLLDSAADSTKIHISIPAREMTELTSMPTSPSNLNIVQVLEEIDKYISEHLSVYQEGFSEIIPVTCGHLPLRSLLHREARFRGIKLKPYWFHYYDLFDETSGYLNTCMNTLDGICSVFQISRLNKTSTDIIYNMNQVIIQLLNAGHIFMKKHVIKNTYKPAVFHVDDPIEPDVVIQIKPIDYKTPISDIIPFFNGVNIDDGGIAVLMSDGRRSNKILIRFTDKQQRDIALLRDKHHFEPGNSRFITMSVIDSQEFMKIAGCSDENVKKYLLKIRTSDQFLIRMKGLPFTVTKTEILAFFEAHQVQVQFGLEGIYLVQKPSGDLNGDAFVIFENEVEARNATNLKGLTIGNRYVEIFQSSPAEMNQVIAGIYKGLKFKSTKMSKISDSTKLESCIPANMVSAFPAKPNVANSGMLTRMVPMDANDADFLTYLGEYQDTCLKISKFNVNSPPGFISYFTSFKSPMETEQAYQRLLQKPFRIALTNREVIVSNQLLPSIGSSAEIPSNIVPSPLNPKLLINNLPMYNVPLLSSLLPPTAVPISQALSIPNPLNLTGINGSLFNLHATPDIYGNNVPVNVLSTMIQPQNILLLNRMLTPLTLSNMKLQRSDLLPIFRGKNSAAIERSDNTILEKSKLKFVYLYGAISPFSQNDLDLIFRTMFPNISNLPKLYQNNQFFYALFNNDEEMNFALQKCPTICHRNQTIQLVPINC